MADKVGFIYITINKLNNKKYIGKCHYSNQGWKTYLGSGTSLLKAIEKYGKENFERQIIEECMTKEELAECEKKWINYFKACERRDFYNIAKGGLGGIPFHTKETRRKLSISHRGHLNPQFGKNISDNHKNILSNVNKNRVFSEKTKMKMSQTRITKKIGTRKVILVNTDEVFDSVIEAEAKYKAHNGHISKVCQGKRKSAGKHPVTGEKLIWRYYERKGVK